MIYLSQHTHVWNLTGGVIHGCRIYSCGVCGDRAYFTEGLDPSSGLGSES